MSKRELPSYLKLLGRVVEIRQEKGWTHRYSVFGLRPYCRLLPRRWLIIVIREAGGK